MRYLFLISSLIYSYAVCASYCGWEGEDGAAGQAGLRGGDGTNLSIRLKQAAPGCYDLSGTDGEPGADGHVAQDAHHCDDCIFDTLCGEGANGGDRGDGGTGGDGGHGGQVYVHYERSTSLDDLQNIQILAKPGLGAAGGHGGLGGAPCLYHSWFSTDGLPGRSGIPGRKGQDGQLGVLKLIPELQALPNSTPARCVSLQQWLEQPIALSALRWSQWPGALALLAPGSILNDTYLVYEGLYQEKLVLDWPSTASLKDKDKIKVCVAVSGSYPDEKTEVQISFATLSSTPTHIAHEAIQGDTKTYTIVKLVSEEEIDGLKFDHLRKEGRELELVISNSLSDVGALSTTFHLDFQRKFIGYKSKFKGEVPAELVYKEGKYDVIKLGLLPIAKKYFTKGKKFRIILNATRNWGSYSSSYQVLDQKLQVSAVY